MRSQPSAEVQESLVLFAGSGKLHSPDAAGNGDHGVPAQAEWRGVPQNPSTSFGVVCPGVQPCDRGSGEHQELVFSQKLVDATAKLRVLQTPAGKLAGGDTRAPFHPDADFRGKLVVVAGVNLGCLR